ncbi:hypothetical protein AAVH_18946 [Aphelenchoides avenae]|nr:hypothetical protein AAVH_18946 [Aphelenchus avenae]
MRNLDGWVKRLSSSARAVLQNDGRSAAPKCSRGLRAPGDYRTNELIEEVRNRRVLWCRDARAYKSSALRYGAYKRVAEALNRRFPEVRPWSAEEVDFHWRTLVQYQYACLKEHGAGEKPHSSTCRFEQMSFIDGYLSVCSDFRTIVPRM